MPDWTDDEELLSDLASAVRAEQAVPARFVEIGFAAFAWRDVDAELAALTFDSAAPGALELTGTRAEPATHRSMTFSGAAVTIELEVTPEAVFGQVIPPAAGQAEVQTSTGRRLVTPIDDVGWFVVRPRPVGLFRLRVSTGGANTVTEWLPSFPS